MSFTVHIKHAGKQYDVPLNTDVPPRVFKESIYAVTGVPLDRMKVMVKGGTLKDDGDWKKIAPKAGQTFMVVGAAGELPKAPEKPIIFLEDLDDPELAIALAKPLGLKNLGNTCYMNATVQALRAVPELQKAVEVHRSAGHTLPPLSASLSALTHTLTHPTSSEAPVPVSFLQALRVAVPQFAERDRREGSMAGYAQQDAEECFSALTNALKVVDGLPGPAASTSAAGESMQVDGASQSSSAPSGGQGKKFIEQYLMAVMRRELKCVDAPEEAVSVTLEQVFKLECNISISTNFMMSGIKDALDQTIEKHSPSLNRDASYQLSARVARLPAYLTVHMVRFAWRRDIGRKAKIMRRVKFPTEFDALELGTPELRERLQPTNTRLKEIARDRAERRKVRRKTHASHTAAGDSVSAAPGEGSSTGAAQAEKSDVDKELEERKKEQESVKALLHADTRDDIGCSESGLYDLVAIVTHKGAAADAGHYMAYVKKSVFHQPSPFASLNPGSIDEDDEDWYKFDDDKVSLFPRDKISTLEGGGEDSSAYLLLYRTRTLE